MFTKINNEDIQHWLIVLCCCSPQEQPEYKVLLFIKNFSSAHFIRNNLWSKQSGSLYIASSLFSIFYKDTSMKKNVDQIGSFAAQWEISER